ncbi:ABC transporter ATP-binding protein [Olivibacter sitiensis]|uniref:ABC transporter ATP-binding protein n=1 Tax=Olivibacter sitiensis TaxID=376470 RepID=UPI001FE1D285|nr:ABC transporter ATP-binding protein [Olivibacter sitiensis]
MMEKIAVSLNHITKTYDKGKVLAVDDVSLQVKQGELFGLIGPDGAGKTSIFRILTTLLLANGGTANVAGYDLVKDFREIRNRVGYMPGKFSLYQDLTIQENLDFFANVFGTSMAQNYELIQDIYDQIKPFKDRRAGKLSGGMKQKLALCCALIHKPEVLLLDEPTTGVDVVSRKEFWDMLKRLKQQGITILVSTPYMDEAKLCERIALMQQGRLMSVNTPDNIVKDFPAKLYAVKSKNVYALLIDLRQLAEVQSCYAFGEFLHVTLKSDKVDGEDWLRHVAERKGHEQVLVKLIEPSIEDSFIRLMNEEE